MNSNGPESQAPVDQTILDPSQQGIEHDRRNRIVALGTALAIGAGALAGCSPGEVNAYPTETRTTTTTEATPTPSETTTTPKPTESKTVSMTLAEAERLLKGISPEMRKVGLQEFDNDKDAETYLSLKKSSKLAIVNYTDVSSKTTNKFGVDVEKKIEALTRNTFGVDVAVFAASPLAKQVYERHNTSGSLNVADPSDYGSVIADVTMPELDASYDAIIALTDNGIPTRGKGEINGIALPTGKYADVAEFSKLLKDTGDNDVDPVNVTAHEWLHALADLGHAKTITAQDGMDFIGYFTNGGPNEPARGDLGKFIQESQFNEFGGENVLGRTSSPYVAETLNATQLYTAEAAERRLDLPRSIKSTNLVKSTTVTYDRTSSKDAIAVIPLAEPLSNGKPAEQGVNLITRLTFVPEYRANDMGGIWDIKFSSTLLDNGSAELCNFLLSPNPADGPQTHIIDMPNGKHITIKTNTAGNLQISYS